MLGLSLALSMGLLAADPTVLSAKDAFQPLNPLIGKWKATGYPEGSREERQKGFWTETLDWSWQFSKDDARIVTTIEKGKHFTRWELQYLPTKKLYQLTALTPTKESLLFTGTLAVGKQKEQILTLERTDATKHETQRLIITVLHHNRFLYRWETKPETSITTTRHYQVGATKEGEAFADVGQGPECIVSGGLAKIPVTHKGKTYYVCCSGCRDAFKDDPDKFVKEYEEKKKK